MKKTLLILAAALVSLCGYAQNAAVADTASDKTPITNPHHFTMSLGYGLLFSGDHDGNVFVNYASDDSHASKMKSGYNLQLDYDYNFHENMAFGLQMSMFNSFDSYYPTSDATDSYSDDRYIFYVGPSFLMHTDLIKDHWTVFGRATAGYMMFRNAVRADAASTATYKRSTIGYGLTGGVSYYIDEYFSVDASVSYLGGSVSSLDYPSGNVEIDPSENLSRLNINVGVKIKL